MTQEEITAVFNMGIAVGRQIDSLNKQVKELDLDRNLKQARIEYLEKELENESNVKN